MQLHFVYFVLLQINFKLFDWDFQIHPSYIRLRYLNNELIKQIKKGESYNYKTEYERGDHLKIETKLYAKISILKLYVVCESIFYFVFCDYRSE